MAHKKIPGASSARPLAQQRPAPSSVERITDILVFTHVAESGNLSETARELDKAPSTVSKLISRLEASLNVRLVNRTSRALSLTEEGRRFYEQCLHIIEAIQNAEASIASSNAPSGVLKIQSVPAFVRHQLARALPDFCAAYPDIDIDLNLSTEHTDIVKNGIDVVIHSGWLPDSQLIVRKIATSRWIVCGSPDYFKAHGVPQDPMQLAGHNCLVQPTQSTWHEWSFLINGLVTPVQVGGSIVCNHADSLLEMAAAGLGLVRVAEFACSHDLRSRRLQPILEHYADPNGQPLVAVYQHKQISIRTKVFLDFLQERFASQPWRSEYQYLS